MTLKNQTTLQTLGNIQFQWKLDIVSLKNLDEKIRRCEQDDISIRKDKITENDIKEFEKLFNENKKLYFFVHHSQFMFNPVFCILLETSHLLSITSLEVSNKFTSANFEDKETFSIFLKLLYSKENLARLSMLLIEIKDIKHYEY